MSKKKTVKVNSVKAPRIFPAKQTKDAATKTQDGFENFAARVGVSPARQQNVMSQGLYTFNLITKNRIQLEAAYRGSWVAGVMIDDVAEDMTRAGIELTTNEQAKRIPDFKVAMSRLKIWQSLCDTIKWGRLYGGAIGVMQIEGQDPSTPLDPETVGKDQFQGLAVYDRWQINPSLQETIDSGPDLGLPKYYYIVTGNTEETNTNDPNGQVKVHFSRVFRYIGIQLPYFQAITEMMWGESVLERPWDRMLAFDQVTMSSANLIERANNRTIGIENFREILAAGGDTEQALRCQFEMMREFQTNEGMTLMDKNDTFATTNYTFAGLSDLQLSFGQQLSGASKIPLVRFFGQSPAGLSSTGESDMRMYYDGINAQQEARCRNPLEQIIRVMWRSCFGKSAPKDLEFTFTPLWQMTAKDKAEIAKSNAETVTGVYESGGIDRATYMKELRQHAGDTGAFSHITDEAVEDAEGEEPPMPEEQKIELQDPPEKASPVEEKKDPPKTKDSAFKRITRWIGK